MANLGDDDIIDEVEEMRELPAPKQIQTDFGAIDIEGDSKLEIIKNMENKVNEMIIQIKHYEDAKSKQRPVYELLEDPRLDEQTVAIDMFNLWRESNGLLIELRSDVRSIQKDLKTFDRIIRQEKRSMNQ